MATIELFTRHSPLAWLLYFTKVEVTIDGRSERLPWGAQVMTVAAGNHDVKIGYRYFGTLAGRTSTSVTLAEGQTLRISYRARSLVFLPGKLAVA